MKVVKLYALTWIILAAALLAAYTTHSLNPIKLTIFGFLGSTLFFMGLVALLPYLMNRHYESKQTMPAGREKRSDSSSVEE